MELEAIFNIPKLRYLAQDETRIGRKTETKRVVTAPGVKPLAQVESGNTKFRSSNNSEKPGIDTISLRKAICLIR